MSLHWKGKYIKS